MNVADECILLSRRGGRGGGGGYCVVVVFVRVRKCVCACVCLGDGADIIIIFFVMCVFCGPDETKREESEMIVKIKIKVTKESFYE